MCNLLSKKVKIVLDNIPAKQAISIVCGLEFSLNNNDIDDAMRQLLVKSIQNAKNDIIAAIGKENFEDIYSSIYPIYGTKNSNAKLN